MGSGSVILSIDLELDLNHQETLLQKRLDALRTELVELTRELRLSATWAVADPALSAATESILSANVGHEIAVSGDRAWLGPGCGRLRMSRELARRFGGARKAGVSVTTLALRNVEHVRDLDLLVEQGITAIHRPPVETPSLARKIAAPAISFGLWHAPMAWRIPDQAAWWTPGAWLAGHEIRWIVRRRLQSHLQIDAQRLVEHSGEPLRCIRRTLRSVAAKRDAGLLTIDTIGKLAIAALADRGATPSRSILRPAA